MEQEDVIALEEFAVAHGGLKRNGEMCFDAESLDELLRAARSLEREACARLCHTMFLSGVKMDSGAIRGATSSDCEEAIRMRSNVEVSGGAEAPAKTDAGSPSAGPKG